MRFNICKGKHSSLWDWATAEQMLWFHTAIIGGWQIRASIVHFVVSEGPCKLAPRACMDVSDVLEGRGEFRFQQQSAATLKTIAERNRCNLLLLLCWQENRGMLWAKTAAGNPLPAVLCLQGLWWFTQLKPFCTTHSFLRSKCLMTTLEVMFLVLYLIL